MSLCVSDWFGFSCGDLVTEIDGRHVGRVEAVHHSSQIKVRWLDTRWISFHERDELRKVQRAAGPRIRPTMLKPSPRRELEDWLAANSEEET